jgi:DNA-binding NarL/FixJ family response regulator
MQERLSAFACIPDFRRTIRDGLDTYRSVLEIHPAQKAIIVSGFSETHRVNAAQSLGAGAYVRNPYVMEKPGLTVRKELDTL